MFPVLAVASILALTGFASSEDAYVPNVYTFQDGYNVTPAEKLGPQFLLEFSEREIAVVRRAMDKLADEHEANPSGIDDYLMGRRLRIVQKLDGGGFGVFAPNGTAGWERHGTVFPMTLPEAILTGFAVSRDRYRQAPMIEPEKPALVARIMNWFMSTAFAQEFRPKMIPRYDGLAEDVDNFVHNYEAIKLFDTKFAPLTHSYPGGNPY